MSMRLTRRHGTAMLAAFALATCGDSFSISHYVIALSWEPAFCELNASKPECRALDKADFAATNLTIHGLWPNNGPGVGPLYCGVDEATKAREETGDWCELPVPEMTDKTRADLSAAMPGTVSCLERHEWIKHGTCTGIEADDYFANTVRLAKAVQATRLAQVIAANVGRTVTPGQLRNAFEADFDAGSSTALSLVCLERHGRRYLTEIRIAIREGAWDGPLEREDLYLEGKPATNRCGPDMWVDTAG
jgi:ribonuclease T2